MTFFVPNQGLTCNFINEDLVRLDAPVPKLKLKCLQLSFAHVFLKSLSKTELDSCCESCCVTVR